MLVVWSYFLYCFFFSFLSFPLYSKKTVRSCCNVHPCITFGPVHFVLFCLFRIFSAWLLNAKRDVAILVLLHFRLFLIVFICFSYFHVFYFVCFQFIYFSSLCRVELYLFIFLSFLFGVHIAHTFLSYVVHCSLFFPSVWDS